MSDYRAPVKDMRFVMDELAGFPELSRLPGFEEATPDLADAIKPWHGRLAYLLAALVLMHVAAGLKHHFVDRDGLLQRMWPHRARATNSP